MRPLRDVEKKMYEQLLCHLIGDYVLQSHTAAVEKTKSNKAAIHHVLWYTVPFAFFLTQDILSLILIAGTHFVIDRYRLAVYVVRWKNRLLYNNRPGSDYNTPTGFPADTPPWLATWLLIIVDNTMHLCINAVILRYLPKSILGV